MGFLTLEAMLIGYARVSTHEQNLTLQTDALKKAGCRKIFDDRVSGAASDRPGLKAALEYVREGDTLLVWRLDRLGRSLKDLIEIIGSLEKRGVGFKSLQESIDTTTSGGRLIFHVFGALAEFERNLIRERTRAGLEAARAEGLKVKGQPLLFGQVLGIDRPYPVFVTETARADQHRHYGLQSSIRSDPAAPTPYEQFTPGAKDLYPGCLTANIVQVECYARHT